MRIVVVESPFRSYTEFDLQRNLAYARALVEHVTLRGDSPVASHLLITQSLDDRILEHRALGIRAGLELTRIAEVHLFGVDLGMSDGMRNALAIAKETQRSLGRIVEELSLPEWSAAMASSSTRALEALVFKYQPKWHVHTR